MGDGTGRYFSFLEGCKDAKACTVLLRGGSKDVLNEVERNLSDAMQVQYSTVPVVCLFTHYVPLFIFAFFFYLPLIVCR